MSSGVYAVIDQIERRLKWYYGTEHVYSEYKPLKDTVEVTMFIMVHGHSFRLDYEYSFPPEPKKMPDPATVTDQVTNCFSQDLKDLWAAGPDRDEMSKVLYNAGSS
jgi:hypothetical protein